MLGFPPGEENPLRRIILFKSRVGENFGILVDSIEDIVSVPQERIETRDNEGEEHVSWGDAA